MSRPACFCCLISPDEGLALEVVIKHGAMKGRKPLCGACHVEVLKVYARQVWNRHTFNVMENALINVRESRDRAFYFAQSGGSWVEPCRPTHKESA